METWEYKTLQRNIVNNETNLDDEINNIAKDGWELFYATVLENLKTIKPSDSISTKLISKGTILFIFRKIKK